MQGIELTDSELLEELVIPLSLLWTDEVESLDIDDEVDELLLFTFELSELVADDEISDEFHDELEEEQPFA